MRALLSIQISCFAKAQQVNTLLEDAWRLVQQSVPDLRPLLVYVDKRRQNTCFFLLCYSAQVNASCCRGRSKSGPATALAGVPSPTCGFADKRGMVANPHLHMSTINLREGYPVIEDARRRSATVPDLRSSTVRRQTALCSV
jgi:hypothetical protein